jgi:raffinose/stachyose/melibiose transport system permease protein
MTTKPPLITRASWADMAFFFGPLVIMYLVFYVFSLGFLLYTSLHRVNISLTGGRWVGFDNFRLLLTDGNFLTALANNLVFATVAIGAGLTLGFFIAVTLSTGVRRKGLFYVAFLLPSLMPLALIASVFRVLLESRFGALNETLRAVGLEALAMGWLIEPTLAYGVVVILFVYLIGLPVMYYTAAMSTINTSVIEAAVLDGAGTWQIMRQILFPLLRATHKTIIVSTVLMTFRAFDIVFFSTQGGPSGMTEITGTYVYRFSTSGNNIGYGSAAALLVMIISLVISILQLFMSRSRT